MIRVRPTGKSAMDFPTATKFVVEYDSESRPNDLWLTDGEDKPLAVYNSGAWESSELIETKPDSLEAYRAAVVLMVDCPGCGALAGDECLAFAGPNLEGELAEPRRRVSYVHDDRSWAYEVRS